MQISFFKMGFINYLPLKLKQTPLMTIPTRLKYWFLTIILLAAVPKADNANTDIRKRIAYYCKH